MDVGVCLGCQRSASSRDAGGKVGQLIRTVGWHHQVFWWITTSTRSWNTRPSWQPGWSQPSMIFLYQSCSRALSVPNCSFPLICKSNRIKVKEMQIKRMSSWQIGKLRAVCKGETSWTAADPKRLSPWTDDRHSQLLLIAQLRHAVDVEKAGDRIRIVEMQMDERWTPQSVMMERRSEPQEPRKYFLSLSRRKS